MIGWGLWMSMAVAGDPVDLEVTIKGFDASLGGTVRCAAFMSADGFPNEGQKAVARVDGAGEPPVCRFSLPPGEVAVSVLHDANDNKKLDTNMMGVPKEGWGVTNDVRPTLRAPTFDEAKRSLSESAKWSVTVGY